MQPASAEQTAVLDRDALASLIESIAAHNDRAAFATLFKHFAPRVKGYLIKIGTDRGQAEELTQEVMVTVWRKAATFDRRQASVSTWLFTIARNRRIDMVRRERRPEIDLSDPLLVPDEPIAPDDQLDAVDREARVAKALKTLPKEQADLVHEAFFLAKSHSEISEQTKIPLGTVKSRLRLAFGRLRKALEGDEP